MPSDALKASRARRHLDRLETLIDSIYALVIVLLVAQFPSPLTTEGEFSNLLEFFSSEKGDLFAPLIGLVMIIAYWIQNNAIFGSLDRTDNKHASIAIAQMLFVLFYLYSADLMDAFPDARSVLAIQSSIFAIMGILNLAGWRYACKDRRLLSDEVTPEDQQAIRRMILPEPLTALVTLPFAAISATAWNLSWLAFPLVGYLVKRLIPSSAE